MFYQISYQSPYNIHGICWLIFIIRRWACYTGSTLCNYTDYSHIKLPNQVVVYTGHYMFAIHIFEVGPQILSVLWLRGQMIRVVVCAYWGQWVLIMDCTLILLGSVQLVSCACLYGCTLFEYDNVHDTMDLWLGCRTSDAQKKSVTMVNKEAMKCINIYGNCHTTNCVCVVPYNLQLSRTTILRSFCSVFKR